MHRFVLWVQGSLVPLIGPPGVFVIAFLDSSLLSIPEINDFLVVTAAAADAGGVWVFVLMATLGSVCGSATLWAIGRRGGEPLLIRRFGADRVERTRAAFKKWDVLALAIPAMLPPPMPFKVFVLSAGVFGLPLRRLVFTLLAARGLRYTFWGTMGAIYGPPAVEYLRGFDAWFRERSLYFIVGLCTAAAAALAVWATRRWRGRAAGTA